MPCRNDDDDNCSNHVAGWLLCEAMVIVQRHKLLKECSIQLSSWWAEHSEEEQKRLRREAAEKLSDRERLALGIDLDGEPVRTRLIGKKRR